jgi:aminopeptidase N
MAISPKARPYLLVLALVLVVAGVLVARIPVEGLTTAPSPSATAAPADGSDGAGDRYYPQDGNGGYDVTDYDVSISYDPATHRLDGQAKITANATAALSRFNLDLQGLQVSSAKVGDLPARFSQEGEHELVITPSGALPAGKPFTTTIVYGGQPQPIEDRALGRGGWQISASGGAFAAGEPHSATSWYPSNDTPRDKARFTLTAKVPDGWSVMSNGVDAGSSSADGWTTYKWSEQKPIATYLTTIGIDKWTIDRSKLPDGTSVVDAYAPGAQDKRSVEQRLPEILAFLSEKFGPYPQQAAGGIFLADNIGFSLETQTRPVYAGWTRLDTVVHENAHQWFGDSVSVADWADICLNECFASYSQWLWAEGKEGRNLDDLYREQVDQSRNRSGYWARKLYDMGRGNEFRGVYDKGILAVHALRRQIGDDAFFKVLKGWTADHREGNASWPEFESYVQKVSGQKLDGFFAAWFRGDTMPPDEYLYPATLHR